MSKYSSDQLATKLRAIALSQWEEQKHLPFEDKNLFSPNPAIKREVRIIGEEAAYAGGASEMRLVSDLAFTAVSKETGMRHLVEPYQMCRMAISELNYEWDGLDTWQA